MMSFDSLFGFILVVGENVSIYTYVFSVYSFLLPSKPSKNILIAINTDSAVLRLNMGYCQKCDRVHQSEK